MTPLDFIVDALAVAASSLTIARTRITWRLRDWCIDRWPTIAHLLECPWCLADWTAAAIVLLSEPWTVKRLRAFVSGPYDVGGMTLYVNNGTGLWPGFALRLGRPSELTRITLRRAE